MADDAQPRPRAPREQLDRARGTWGSLSTAQRRVLACAALLVASLLLPWYSSRTSALRAGTLVVSPESSLSAFGAFSYVEASVLVAAGAVIALIAARGDGRGFLLPARDGTVVGIAGGWAALLVVVRLFDRPTGPRSAEVTTLVGLSWGIFVSLAIAAALTVLGLRLRATEPPGPLRSRLPDRAPRPDGGGDSPAAGTAPPVRPRARVPWAPTTSTRVADRGPRTGGPVGRPWWRRGAEPEAREEADAPTAPTPVRDAPSGRPVQERPRPSGAEDPTRVLGDDCR